MSGDREIIRMPFTDKPASELQQALYLIVGSSLQVEFFDAFLAEYSRSQNLDKSVAFAQCEWDC